MQSPIGRPHHMLHCSECSRDSLMPNDALAVPFVCPACWFWYQFATPIAEQAPRIVAGGVLYGIDMRDSAEGVGKRHVVRYFDAAQSIISTKRVRVIGQTPDGTPDTAIVQRVR